MKKPSENELLMYTDIKRARKLIFSLACDLHNIYVGHYGKEDAKQAYLDSNRNTDILEKHFKNEF